ncbi:MAG: hypothetical protein JWN03_6429 [Nocardia sp.]|uniref:hypothetical protein n=1 Tax=Nocardia sp. TaxID=1821 RepID=UPI002633F6F6|nr:hypothetical protein [Nocardia sp.]MCU1646154.1 hypothetical protein [Nocardia sp.]
MISFPTEAIAVLGADGVPAYSTTEVWVGSAIVLLLVLTVVIALLRSGLHRGVGPSRRSQLRRSRRPQA